MPWPVCSTRQLSLSSVAGTSMAPRCTQAAVVAELQHVATSPPTRYELAIVHCCLSLNRTRILLCTLPLLSETSEHVPVAQVTHVQRRNSKRPRLRSMCLHQTRLASANCTKVQTRGGAYELLASATAPKCGQNRCCLEVQKGPEVSFEFRNVVITRNF